VAVSSCLQPDEGHSKLGAQATGTLVDVDEWPPGSGAPLVEDTGDDALAGPGLALDEHGRPSATWAITNEPRDLPPHGFDGWALADQVCKRGSLRRLTPASV
jgi:hypothetical protein